MAELCERMRFRPYAFVAGFDELRDGPRLAGFKHRTFREDDAIWLCRCLHTLLRRVEGVEAAFAVHLEDGAPDVGPAIQGFCDALLAAEPGVPARLAKHLPRPSTGSACKRMCMYLRWMVRPGPVDLGLWTRIHPRQLVLPLDVHSGRAAREMGLLNRPSDDWRSALHLTEQCRTLCPEDPARYDFALFAPAAYGASDFTGASRLTRRGAPISR
jgi:uncharacterized protein (TIGR02757 family)